MSKQGSSEAERAERWVGIDVAKATLECHCRPAGRQWQVPNTPAGWAVLIAELQPVGPVGIVLEATGGYERGLVVALDAAGLTPVVANPAAVRFFARSGGQRGKTDRLDAALLAEYGARVQPMPQAVPSETARRLRAILARREQVTKLLVAERNRVQQAEPVVRPLIEQHLDVLRAERRQLDALLATTIAADPVWAARVAQLRSVPGIGLWTATVLAVQVPELGTRSPKQLAALIGVAPHPRDSGRARGPRHISGGRAEVRRTLYQAVHSACRVSRDPVLRGHFEHLIARGKPHKQALVACMRRLLGILNAMVRDGLTWDQTQVGQGRFLARAA